MAVLSLVELHLHVMRILGHKNSNNALMYTQLVNFKNDDYVSKVASSPKEACKLVEAGFEHVCRIDNVHVFRTFPFFCCSAQIGFPVIGSW